MGKKEITEGETDTEKGNGWVNADGRVWMDEHIQRKRQEKVYMNNELANVKRKRNEIGVAVLRMRVVFDAFIKINISFYSEGIWFKNSFRLYLVSICTNERHHNKCQNHVFQFRECVLLIVTPDNAYY